MLEYPNRAFYNGALRTAADRTPNPCGGAAPYAVVQVTGVERRVGTSYCNPREAEVAVTLALALQRRRGEGRVHILVPYTAALKAVLCTMCAALRRATPRRAAPPMRCQCAASRRAQVRTGHRALPQRRRPHGHVRRHLCHGVDCDRPAACRRVHARHVQARWRPGGASARTYAHAHMRASARGCAHGEPAQAHLAPPRAPGWPGRVRLGGLGACAWVAWAPGWPGWPGRVRLGGLGACAWVAWARAPGWPLGACAWVACARAPGWRFGRHTATGVSWAPLTPRPPRSE